MATDTSIYDQANKPAVALLSPNDIMAKQLQIQQGINANKLFQATNAAGQAFQGAIGPDGKLDQNALGLALRNLSPDQAMAVQPALAQAATQQGQNVSNTTADYDLQMKRLTSGAAGALAVLAAHNGQAPQDAMKSYYDAAAADGHITPAQRDQAEAAFGPDPMANASIVRQRAAQSLQMQEALAATTPRTGSVDQGPTIQGTSQAPSLSPTPGAISPVGGTIATGLPTKAQKIQQVPGPLGSKGETTSQTLGQNLGARGLDENGDPIPNPAFKGLPSTLRNPNAPPPSGGTMTTGMGPAATSAASTTGADSAKGFQQYADDSKAAVAQGAILDNMLSDTKQFSPGPGASKIALAEKLVQRISPSMATSFGLDPKVAANESFNKFAAQLANAQGAGSDARLAVNVDANPHADMSPAGADLIIRQLQGNADYTQARGKLASAYPDQTNRAGFESQIGSQLDPRTFQYARMTPQQKTEYFNNIANKSDFIAKYTYAKTHGLIGVGNQ